MSVADVLLVALSGFAAGLINAIAGGGTLVSFPALVAVGLPAVSANVTNTIALVPGYLGAAYAQRRDLLSYVSRLRALLIIAALGGLVGSVLLVNSSDELFSDLVPVLILLACALLGLQNRIRNLIVKRRMQRVDDAATTDTADAAGSTTPTRHTAGLALLLIVGAAAVYGGYFGAGLGIMLLAALGIALDDPLPQINSLKSTLSLAINLVAALFFAFSDHVVWDFAAVMAVASVAGGIAGGRIAGKLKPEWLRAVVIAFGIIAAVAFWL